MTLDHNLNTEDKTDSTSSSRRVEGLIREARTLGEALCISAIYLGIGALLYHGCTGTGEEEQDKVKEQKYEPINVWEIPLQ